jgi:hypothetical protein
MKVLESVWVVEAPMGQANELAGQLRDTIKGSDRLLVIEVTNDAASLNLLVKEEVFNATLVGAQLGVSL